MYILILYVILLASVAVRVINLNYNSPFNDEAIYVVLGRLGLFQYDWGTYNASYWVAGNIYLYPVMTALSYMSGGILGSRLLNVLFGVLTVETIFALTMELISIKSWQRYCAGLIAASLVGGATVSLYISRLATYDMPSFFFLFLSLYLLVKAQQAQEKVAKWYFFSAISLFLSFAIKIITGFYLPLVVIYAFFISRQNPLQRSFWKGYFLFPLLVGLALYALISLPGNIYYLTGQTARENAPFALIWNSFKENTFYIWGFYLVGTIGMLLKGDWKRWFGLSMLGLLIPLIHVITHRFTTLDKHIFLTVAFFALISGIGIANLITLMPKKVFQIAALSIVTLMIGAFWFYSYRNLNYFNHLWENNHTVLTFLSEEVRPDDKVLTEAGPAAILATYDKNYPINNTTFDYLDYHNYKGDEVYSQAVKDGYFDLIELEDESKSKIELYSRVHQIVKENMADNYQLIYSQNGYQIYRRTF